MLKLNIMCGTEIFNVRHGYICINSEIPKPDDIKIEWGENFTKEDINKAIENKQFLLLDVNKNKLPFEDNSIDEIVSNCGIGRGYGNEFALNEIVRIIKPNKKVILNNSFLHIIPILCKYFQYVDIKCINYYYEKEDCSNSDFRFTCYN